MNEVKEQVKKIGDHNNRREFNKLVRMMQGGARPPVLQGGARYSTGEDVRIGDVVKAKNQDRYNIDIYRVIGIGEVIQIRSIRNRGPNQRLHTLAYGNSDLVLLTRTQPKFKIGDIVKKNLNLERMH